MSAWWARATSAADASTSAPPPPPSPPPWPARAWRAAARAAKLGAALHVGFSYVAFFSQVNGPSMFPTFGGRGWNVVLAEALPGVQDRVSPGDVVICVRPVNPKESVIKRVTAVAGDTVAVYAARGGGGAVERFEVPPGHVWLQGDNLAMSRDSREYGPVPLGLVKGRVVCQVLPAFKWVRSSAATTGRAPPGSSAA